MLDYIPVRGQAGPIPLKQDFQSEKAATQTFAK
jgi:hypothetical protein